jgi:carbamoylphosphate synthase large subunit
MRSINILFLGAGKRLSLLERFLEAAAKEQVGLSLYSVEGAREVPIARVARVVVGPRFTDPSLQEFLVCTALRHDIHMVVPNMDSATIPLAHVKHELGNRGCWAVVSEYEKCVAMEDKLLADQWFRERGVPIPAGEGFPVIVKGRHGFGSRDQFVAHNEPELRIFLSNHAETEYIIQPFVSGQEYTVDAYVDRSGRLLGALSRKRLEVSAGEVDVSETHRHQGMLRLTARILSERGWEGPITLQFVDGEGGL